MTVQQLIEVLQKIKDPNTIVFALSQPSAYETIAEVEKTLFLSQAKISVIAHGKAADAIVLILQNLYDNAN